MKIKDWEKSFFKKIKEEMFGLQKRLHSCIPNIQIPIYLQYLRKQQQQQKEDAGVPKAGVTAV